MSKQSALLLSFLINKGNKKAMQGFAWLNDFKLLQIYSIVFSV